MANVRTYRLHAENATVGTSYEQVCNFDAGITRISETSATANTIDVKSGSVQDKVDGTGARSVFISGVDINGRYFAETIVPTGTTEAVSIKPNIANINEAYARSWGSGKTTAGAIAIDSVTGSDTLGLIEAGLVGIQNCFWHVPIHATAYVKGYWFHVVPVGTAIGAVQFAMQHALYGGSGVPASETFLTFSEHEYVEADSDLDRTTGGLGSPPGFHNFPGRGFPLYGNEMVMLSAKQASGSSAVSGGFIIEVEGSGAQGRG